MSGWTCHKTFDDVTSVLFEMISLLPKYIQSLGFSGSFHYPDLFLSNIIRYHPKKKSLVED